MYKLINNDTLLYRSEKINYLSSLEYAKNLEKRENDKLVFHSFWRVPRDFGLKQVSVIKSIIVAHKHKLDKIEINLWSNVDLFNNEYFQEISKYVNLKIWDMNEEIKNTILEDCHFLKNPDSINDNFCWLEGDLFRLLVLHKYGGFYIDMDVLVLRDMSPLNNLEFLYQWGPTGFKCFHTDTVDPNFRMNGAIMRLSKGSDLSLEFLEILKSTHPFKNSTVWGSELYSKTIRNEVLALPCIWFNSEWGYEDTILEPFKKNDNIKFFDGAFTWHWHNRWDQEIEIGCKFDILYKQQDKEFKLIN
jgi:hypothetical protein